MFTLAQQLNNQVPEIKLTRLASRDDKQAMESSSERAAPATSATCSQEPRPGPTEPESVQCRQLAQALVDECLSEALEALEAAQNSHSAEQRQQQRQKEGEEKEQRSQLTAGGEC